MVILSTFPFRSGHYCYILFVLFFMLKHKVTMTTKTPHYVLCIVKLITLKEVELGRDSSADFPCLQSSPVGRETALPR